jgi:hypothetical protein
MAGPRVEKRLDDEAFAFRRPQAASESSSRQQPVRQSVYAIGGTPSEVIPAPRYRPRRADAT